MNLNDFFDINFTDVLSLIVSILTLILAFRIYKNFDVKKAHINKQLETVLLLVEEINKTQIQVLFWRKTPKHVLERLPENAKKHKAVLESWYYSLFIIGDLNNQAPKFETVYLSSDVKKILPFISFINNPLLPSEIAKKLSEFYSPFANYGKFEVASEKYVELKPLKFENIESILQFPDFVDAYKSWDNFILASKKLKEEIIKWLKQYGSDDINLNLYLQNPHS